MRRTCLSGIAPPLVAVALALIGAHCAIAQPSDQGIPPGLRFGHSPMPEATIVVPNPGKGLDIQTMRAPAGAGTPLRAGVSIPTDICAHSDGQWHVWPNGQVSWVARIESPTAPALRLVIDGVDLPPDAQLFVYSNGQSPPQAFDQSDAINGVIVTHTLSGERVTVEYLEGRMKPPPDGPPGGAPPAAKGRFRIAEVVYLHTGPEALLGSKGLASSGPCNVNINCAEGNAWAKQKRGVVRISLREGMSWYWCTGTLMNNTAQDGTPYVLTAAHCGSGASASDREQWRFYFNYEQPGCADTGSPPIQVISGSTLLAQGPMDGGSDFQLLRLYSSPPLTWRPFFNGWDRSAIGATSGVSIHHPGGDTKKISTFTVQAGNASPTIAGVTLAPNSAWRVNWVATANGHGVTEGGSSGGPLFNQHGLVVGTLSGGIASCTNRTAVDYFGKLGFHWLSNGTSPAARLSPWLDPKGLNPLTLGGFDPAGSLYANFTVNRAEVTVGHAVTFTDASGGGSISSWAWSFGEGAQPSTAIGAGPHHVIYSAPGLKTVTLTVNNSASVTRTNLIRVWPSPYAPPAGLSGSQMGPNTVRLAWEPPTLLQREGFELHPNFSLSMPHWIMVDRDLQPTFSIANVMFPNMGYTGSFIVFNPTQTIPAMGPGWAPLAGSKYAASFSANPGPNNDWLISPPLKVNHGYILSFAAKSASSQFALERMRVGVSALGPNPNQFSIISSPPFLNVPNQWALYSFDLSPYQGQTVHIGINSVSDDAFALLIDDVRIAHASAMPKLAPHAERTAIGHPYQKALAPHVPMTSGDGGEAPKSILAHSGYNIYRDGILIHTVNDPWVTAFSDTLAPAGLRSYWVTSTFTSPQAESAHSDTLTIEVHPGAASFTVTSGGQPIANALVCLDSAMRCLATDSQGRGTFSLPNGHYPYTVVSVPFDTITGTVTVSGSVTPVPVILTPSAAPTHPVSLQVNSGHIAIPAAHIRVQAYPHTLLTNSSGATSINLPVGSHPFTAWAPGYRATSGTINVSASGSNGHLIELFAAEYPVTLLATNPDNRAVAGAQLWINGLALHTPTSEFGLIHTTLPNGQYQLTARLAGQEVIQPFQVDGQPKTVNIQLELPASASPALSPPSPPTIYPNPFDTRITIAHAMAIGRVEVYNLIGQRLISSNHQGSETVTICTAALPPGVYIVRVITHRGEGVSKRMVKR